MRFLAVAGFIMAWAALSMDPKSMLAEFVSGGVVVFFFMLGLVSLLDQARRAR